MPIIQNGSVNLSSLSVPDFYLEVVPPRNNLINGVPTNRLGIVGTATWGKKNSPVTIGNLTEYIQNFGNIQTNKYDLGTIAQSAFLQGANDLVCVRVTDGTDLNAFAELLDTSSIDIIGAKLTTLYTGTTGNTLQVLVGKGSSYTPSAPTYRVSIALPNTTPEIFDNIGGTGSVFWQNLVNAINLGQGTIRPPSQLVVATLAKGIGAVNVTTGGAGYTTAPTVSFTGGGGTGATATAILGFSVGNITVDVPGSGYTTATVTATGGGGTGFVGTVNLTSGAVTSITINNGGSGYTSAPILTIAGNGTGATATAVLSAAGSVISISLTASGSGYTSAPGVGFTGGGGTGAAATAVVGSVNPPEAQTYVFSGGTNGIANVTSSELIGADVAPNRTGMYALRNSTSSVVILADVDDTTTWSTQVEYGLSEGSYMLLVGQSGESIATAITNKQAAGIDNYSAKVILGDWIYYNDTINNQLRVISPQGFIGGVLVSLSPEQSSLNKQMQGIVATQTTYQSKVYSSADLQQLALAGIDVITKPLPRGNVFGARFGRNSSSEDILHGDNYTRMTYFLELTLNANMGYFVGFPQTKDVRREAKDTLESFLQNLKTLEMIDEFSVVLDDSNNPPNSVSLGNMIADVKVRYLSIIDYFIVRLEGGQSVTVEKQSTLPSI